ncbi:NAD(P)H-hydrate epimerase [Roseateles amylovorans]|uniref:Bifunctional NAD(P)H-hydrate repair enzyme n=1 Tax=Roseateles amylovorans TaxID=2978473 RepID=A0ABY6AXM2_9BURK|nr:NAD(P)H-hydrate epimerase [Roseateles amylovorans]UXH77053.1 NAD(P)H-hydrate epimerase [Roseateles amylovorans]
MHPLLPTTRDWPLHDAAASRRQEAAALGRHPAHTLIERAGLAVARLALALAPHAQRAVVFAGPGNNGGDGLIAARHLALQGWTVDVIHVGPSATDGSDADHALKRLQVGAGIQCSALPSAPPTRADLVIDALLGLGASRPAEGDIAAAIRLLRAMRADGALVLAVDLPSGLHANTGRPLGHDTVHADHTLSLLTLKPGLLTGEGRDRCGQLWFDDLGERSTEPASAQLIGRSRILDWQQAYARAATSHKGRHGDVVVLGGAPHMRGAAWLAASAALTAGAGRVYAALPEDDGQPWPPRPELMHWDPKRWDEPATSWRDGVAVCGCGGGTAIAPPLSRLLPHVARLVLDADALNLVAADPALQAAVVGRARLGLRTVMTPHPLEAARLLGLPGAAEVQADRIAAAQALARRFQCCVVVKGSGSVIAADGLDITSSLGDRSHGHAGAMTLGETRDGSPQLAINSTGSSALSTAGTGDVLAGWIGGLWAQALDISPFELACAAVAWHGAAAESHHGPLLAADLVAAMARLHERAP